MNSKRKSSKPVKDNDCKKRKPNSNRKNNSKKSSNLKTNLKNVNKKSSIFTQNKKKPVSRKNVKSTKTRKVNKPDIKSQSLKSKQNEISKNLVNANIPAKRQKGRPRLKFNKLQLELKTPASKKVTNASTSNSNLDGLNNPSKLSQSVNKASDTKTEVPKKGNTRSKCNLNIKENKRKLPVNKCSKEVSGIMSKSKSDLSMKSDLKHKLKSNVSLRKEPKQSFVMSDSKKTKKAQKKPRANKSVMSRKRGHRVASLNAIAKVKLLCESDRDAHNSTSKTESEPQKSKSTVEKSEQIHSKSNNRHNSKKDEVKNEPLNTKKILRKKTIKSTKTKVNKIISRKRKSKRKTAFIDKDVEIIDTRRCKRMASLNASAMMAATYLPESRIEKRSSVDPPVVQNDQSNCFDDPLSNVCNTIDDVVRHWSSTIERHIEISPNSSDNLSDQNCKTTVKTTVKHVKMRRNNTLVETISTQVEQQNILPESMTPKKRVSPKGRSSRQKVADPNDMIISTNSISSPSAFTPCSSHNSSSFLQPTSLESISLLPPSQNSFASSSSFTVQNYSSNTSSCDGVNTSTTKKRDDRNQSRPKSKRSATSSAKKDISPSKPTSFISKYEVKTIQTRVESSINDSNPCHNSTLTNSIILTANNAPNSNSIINFNSSLPNLATNNALMSYNFYQHLPFQIIPLNPWLTNNQQASNPQNRSPFLSGEPAPQLNYINLSPFNAPILQYQPVAATFPALNSGAHVTAPISVPLVQFSNPTQPYTTYNLLDPRANNSLLGASYINPASSSSGLFQTPNPVINVLPSNSDVGLSASNFVHRPVPCHPQPGQVSSVNHSNVPSNYMNNSSVLATSHVIGNVNSTGSNNANIFQSPVIRPSISGVAPINVPLSPFGNSTILLQGPVSSNTPSGQFSSTKNSNSQPSVSSSTSASSRQAPLAKNVNKTTPITTSIEPCQVMEQENSHTVKTGNEMENTHLKQLTNMTNKMMNQIQSTPSLKSGDNFDKPKNNTVNGKVNRSKKLLDSNKNKLNSVLNSRNKKSNGKHSPPGVKLGRSSALSNSQIDSNGMTSYNSNSSGEKKRPSKVQLNGLKNSGSMKHSKLSQDYKLNQSAVNKLPCNDKNNKGINNSQPNQANGSMLNTSSRVPLVNNGQLVKKKHRPIIHGWSWEGESFERCVYINNEEQSYLRKCYHAIKHVEGEIIRVRDCVLLKSGPKKTDLPFVAKITALWESPEKDMMMSLLWYYRPEHTDIQENYINGEIFASRHRDANSVACIDDKCYVLTYNEYCRYKRNKAHSQAYAYLQPDKSSFIVPKYSTEQLDLKKERIPPLNTLPELVFCSRKVYDFRQKRILKNPN